VSGSQLISSEITNLFDENPLKLAKEDVFLLLTVINLQFIEGSVEQLQFLKQLHPF